MTIETTKGFDIFPKVQYLEKQLGAPSWTPEFIRRWHAHLWQAQINGVPVVRPIDPSTVCKIPLPLSSGTTVGYDGTSFDWITMEKTICKPGTFFQRIVGVLYDNRPTIVGGDGKIYSTPIFGVTMAIMIHTQN